MNQVLQNLKHDDLVTWLTISKQVDQDLKHEWISNALDHLLSVFLALADTSENFNKGE